MTTQTLTIVNTLDDGFQQSGGFTTSAAYMGSTDVDVCGGFSFVATAAIPAGSTINSAYFRCYHAAVDSGTGPALIGVENADPTTNTRWSSSHLPLSATIYTAVSSGSTNWIDRQNRYLFGSGDDLPSAITSAIQSLVDGYGGIAIGERINIRVSGTGGWYADVHDFTGGTNLAELFIDWTAGAPAVTNVVEPTKANILERTAFKMLRVLMPLGVGPAVAASQTFVPVLPQRNVRHTGRY